MPTPALAPADAHRLVEQVGLSGPVDPTRPYDASSLSGKTVLITGGASGVGAALARSWASLGAHIVIGDLDIAAGESLVAELRASSSSSSPQHHHFARCDVTDWRSQVALFNLAVRASPAGRIDVVVPNAGVSDYDEPLSGRGFESPAGLDAEDPPAPGLGVLDVNVRGVFYTVHLALFWLARNNVDNNETPSQGSGSSKTTTTTTRDGDRVILLIGSIAGLTPLPGQAQYCASKHAVTGLFRSLRGTARTRQGVRVNLLCPYFVDTGLIPTNGLAFLAGLGTASVGDVVDAATRLVADESVVGRALVVGPRLAVVEVGDDGEPVAVAPAAGARGQGKEGDGSRAVWECYAHDYESVESWVWRYVRLLNTVEAIRGWTGWAKDMIYIYFFRKHPRAAAKNR